MNVTSTVSLTQRIATSSIADNKKGLCPRCLKSSQEGKSGGSRNGRDGCPNSPCLEQPYRQAIEVTKRTMQDLTPDHGPRIMVA